MGTSRVYCTDLFRLFLPDQEQGADQGFFIQKTAFGFQFFEGNARHFHKAIRRLGRGHLLVGSRP
jgi:hypothetical protein